MKEQGAFINHLKANRRGCTRVLVRSMRVFFHAVDPKAAGSMQNRSFKMSRSLVSRKNHSDNDNLDEPALSNSHVAAATA